MCRCRDALRRLAIRKIDRREHPGVRRPFHTAKANGCTRCMNGKPPPANPCSKILCKSCRRFTTSRAPNKKTVYTPGLDPSGSTHRRLHNIARSTVRGNPGVPRMGHGMGPRRPRARASRPCGGAPGGVVSSMQWPVRSRAVCNRAGLSTCPNALVSRHGATRDFRMRNTNQTPRIDPAYKLRHEP